MKYLCIPDCHLKPEIFDMAEKFSNKTDNYVFLGDLVDDWDCQFNRSLYEETLERAIRFAKDHPGMLWCIGNHDYSYLFPIDYWKMNSGHSNVMEDLVATGLSTIRDQLDDWKQFGIAHREGEVVFSHAGFCKEWAERSGLVDPVYDDMPLTQKDGIWDEDGPMWLRPTATSAYPELLQVVGHTPVTHPYKENGFLYTDTFSTLSSHTPFGNKKFVIVDTDSRRWHIA